MLFCCFEAFLWKIHRELIFLVKKVAISERSTETLRKFVYLNKFEKVQIPNPEENLDLFKQMFLIKSIK